MATFFLIHGAAHGGWCWRRVAPLLEARGHRVLAPDLAAMGSDGTPPAEVSLNGWTDDVEALILAQSEPVHLVGHSMGGFVVAAVSERCPDRIAAAIYLTAVVPRSGDSLGSWAAQAMAEDGDGPPRTIVVDAAFRMNPALDLADFFYHDAGPADVRFALDRLGPTPLAPFAEPLTLTDERFGTVPRIYIETLDDRTLPIAIQREAQAGLDFRAVHSLPGDHSPFFARAEELAALLDTVSSNSAHPE